MRELPGSLLILSFCLVGSALALCACTHGKSGHSGGTTAAPADLSARQVTFSSGGAEDPSLIRLDDGCFLLAWISGDGLPNVGIWCARSTDGRNWDTPSLVAPAGSGHDYYPSIIQTQAGGFLVAWFSTRSGNWDIWVADSADSETWSSPRQVTTDAAEDWAPSLAQSTDGTFWLAWASTRLGTKDIFLASSSDGANWSSPQAISVNSGDEEDLPSLVAQGTTLALLWVNFPWQSGAPWDAVFSNPDTELWFATSSDGVNWSTPVRLTSDVNVDTTPSLLELGPNRLAVCWTTNAIDLSGDNRAAEIVSGALAAPVDLQPNTGVDYSPKSVVDQTGICWTAWVSDRSGTRNIWLGGTAFP